MSETYTQQQMTIDGRSLTIQEGSAVTGGISGDIIAAEYDSTQTYNKGDWCIYEGELYQWTSSSSTTGTFNTTYWSKKILMDVIDEKIDSSSALNTQGTKSAVKLGVYATPQSTDSTTYGAIDIGNGAIAHGLIRPQDYPRYSRTCNQVDYYDALNATGAYSHAEYNSNSVGEGSHAEGNENIAIGKGSHVEGDFNYTTGQYSHVEGYYNQSNYNYQHVQGKYNDNKATTLVEIGNGTAWNARSNIFEAYMDRININGAIYKNGSEVITPVAGNDTTKFLCNDGTWAKPTLDVASATITSIFDAAATRHANAVNAG